MIDKETILRIARESGLGVPQLNGVDWAIPLGTEAFAAALLAHRAESGVEVPEPQPVNESGSTMTITRWMVETPHGWVGAWDKGAITGLLNYYGNSRAAEALERAIQKLDSNTYNLTKQECIDEIRSLTP